MSEGEPHSASAPEPEQPLKGTGTAPPVTIVHPITGETVTMTKSAAKKLTRRVMRDQKREATKHERRARERARRKERRKQTKEQIKNDPAAAAFLRVPKVKPEPFGARVVVDLGFDDLMTPDEATSLAAQLGYLYGVNRSSSHPFHEVIFAGAGRLSGQALGFEPPPSGAFSYPEASTNETSLFQDRVGQHMEGKSRGMWRRWKGIRLLEYGGLESLWETPAASNMEPCTKEDVIYLTADTDDTIECLEPGKTYVIGGIVDRNRYKHLCAKKAEALGLRMARLPIDPSFLDGQHMQARKVLTVNQVFAILVGWTETRDWTEALKRGLPARKFDTSAEEPGAAEADEEAASSEKKETV
ncbi:tRNA (guanine(9)-N(1))-methyltransferase [Malassezia caprae]|uniref:tRNA (guanine(9)-N1)-methyltransferase n=1 Tax=Malassezia caprae TaxID=1381934 RepID=A0AAF0E5B6_9BASI|nr:tRNA (guanine(9)-N(1))-methyltransferase [Malassezia caprae]